MSDTHPLNVPIRLQHSLGRKSSSNIIGHEPIELGIPLPKSRLYSAKGLYLAVNDNKAIPVNSKTLASWKDNSIQWLLLEFQLPEDFDIENNSITLKESDTPSAQRTETRFEIKNSENQISVEEENHSFSIPKKQLQVIQYQNQNTKTELNGSIDLRNGDNDKTTALVESTELCASGPCKVDITQKGRFAGSEGELCLRFTSCVSVYPNSALIKWTFTLHNPSAARHENGLWDLGDPNSVYFKQLTASFPLGKILSIDYSLESEQERERTSSSDFSVFQHSSGGKNWDSANHLNSNSEIPFKMRGYESKIDGETGSGLRASPIIHAKSEEFNLHVAIEDFWQNFPKAIRCSEDTLFLDLFPPTGDTLHELQGGESKTHTVYLSFSGESRASSKLPLSWLRNKLIATVDSQHYEQSFATRGQFSCAENAETQTTWGIIQDSLTGPDNFFEKREEIDEFGWRNYGDVFADHESLYQSDGSKLISHYNNQYDLVLGFAKQFMRTGDTRWFNLMNDLAQHVYDIDIYKTNEDRAEYNGGLFWHTDHYLDAGTSSHRTYSNLQLGKTDNTDHGGGPGGQHCYTTGLLVHHFLTGSVRSKEAVMSLSSWIENNYEGTGSIVETLLAFKNRFIPGYKNAFSKGHEYPLDRGIGNYIIALLDRFALTQEPDLLTKVANIITKTVHPKDSLDQRDLKNVEETWFYTVFFQAIARFLHTKETLEQFDQAFYYARDCLLHYVSWMKDHEQPYLSAPEKLEYPNDTWAAQDIRKACLFAAASYFTPMDNSLLNDGQASKEALIAKAEFFYEYVASTLNQSSEKSFSRIIAILMQNSGQRTFYLNTVASDKALRKGNLDYGLAPENINTTSLSKLIARIFKAGIKLSIKNELNWIRTRS